LVIKVSGDGVVGRLGGDFHPLDDHADTRAPNPLIFDHMDATPPRAVPRKAKYRAYGPSMLIRPPVPVVAWANRITAAVPCVE